GCARGADEARLREDLQARLNRDVKPDLFQVVALRREGSAPLPGGESGGARVIVYFNVTLQLASDYSFGGWDQLSPSSVAYALGATENGVFGLQAENRPGDLVRAYGSALYEQTADGWTPIAALPAAASPVPNIEGTAPPTRSKQLIDRLAAMVNLPPPGVPPQHDEIIAEELARASENIERRVKRREHTFTLASGLEDSEYARFGASLITAVNEVAPALRLRQRYSQGSVENASLLARGEADYAIVQGDVAAAALAGEDVFARGGPLANLRAVGGLFPEAIHVAVLPDSPIRDIAQLRGQRVDIGLPTSGTRFDAVAVLAAHGLAPADLSEAREEGPTVAISRLQHKQLDAVFVTAAAPSRALQQLAVQPGLRLLPVKGPALERLVQSHPGLTPLTLPANTYPRQQEAVTTVASTALLLTTVDAPDAEVERVADLVFNRMPNQYAGSADVIKVSARNELRGVTIPLHPGAAGRSR
ncbi:MAG TPA: TAXI family TRAP transporter solute-binding subunit, partial [Vicinamibacterales bacterium]